MKADIVIAHIKINTGLTLPQLAAREGVSKQALYNTLAGVVKSERMRGIIAMAANVPESDIWPQEKAA